MEAGVQTLHAVVGLNRKASAFEPSRRCITKSHGVSHFIQQRELVKPKSWKIESTCIYLGCRNQGDEFQPLWLSSAANNGNKWW